MLRERRKKEREGERERFGEKYASDMKAIMRAMQVGACVYKGQQGTRWFESLPRNISTHTYLAIRAFVDVHY